MYLTGGDWDAALVPLADALVMTSSPGERSRLLGRVAMLRAARGEQVVDLLAELDAAVGEVADPQVRADVGIDRAESALIQGDTSTAHDQGVAASETFMSVSASLGLQAAVRAAAWDTSLPRVRAGAERLQALQMTGVMLRAQRVWAWACVAALEDRSDDARAGFQEALRLRRGAGLDFEVARTGLDMVLLLGLAEPEARAAGDEAMAIFERVGARAYLDKLETALTPGGKPARAEPARPEVARPVMERTASA